jgi:hypothetical protein
MPEDNVLNRVTLRRSRLVAVAAIWVVVPGPVGPGPRSSGPDIMPITRESGAGTEKQSLELARSQFARTRRSGTISGRAEFVPIVQELWTRYRNHLPPNADGTQTPPAEITWK